MSKKILVLFLMSSIASHLAAQDRQEELWRLQEEISGVTRELTQARQKTEVLVKEGQTLDSDIAYLKQRIAELKKQKSQLSFSIENERQEIREIESQGAKPKKDPGNIAPGELAQQSMSDRQKRIAQLKIDIEKARKKRKQEDERRENELKALQQKRQELERKAAEVEAKELFDAFERTDTNRIAAVDTSSFSPSNREKIEKLKIDIEEIRKKRKDEDERREHELQTLQAKRQEAEGKEADAKERLETSDREYSNRIAQFNTSNFITSHKEQIKNAYSRVQKSIEELSLWMNDLEKNKETERLDNFDLDDLGNINRAQIFVAKKAEQIDEISQSIVKHQNNITSSCHELMQSLEIFDLSPDKAVSKISQGEVPYSRGQARYNELVRLYTETLRKSAYRNAVTEQFRRYANENRDAVKSRQALCSEQEELVRVAIPRINREARISLARVQGDLYKQSLLVTLYKKVKEEKKKHFEYDKKDFELQLAREIKTLVEVSAMKIGNTLKVHKDYYSALRYLEEYETLIELLYQHIYPVLLDNAYSSEIDRFLMLETKKLNKLYEELHAFSPFEWTNQRIEMLENDLKVNEGYTEEDHKKLAEIKTLVMFSELFDDPTLFLKYAHHLMTGLEEKIRL